jgi:hypothetical protein
MNKDIIQGKLKKRLFFKYTEHGNNVDIRIYKGITKKDIDLLKNCPEYANKTIEFDLSEEINKQTSLPVTKTDNHINFGSVVQFDISEDMIREWFNALDD